MFVYRTIDDVAALRGWVEEKRRNATTEGGWERPVRGGVIGGGLLGLEAAGALKALGAQATVIQFGTHLMDAQIDLGGGEALKRLINGMGIAVRCDTGTKEMRVSRKTGHVGRLDFVDGGRLDVDVVVMATGVRPRDELVRAAGLEVGERGGAVVDLACRTEDPHVWAIGEVACIEGRCIGLVAPGYAMAEVVADRLLGGEATFPGADTATKLKLQGVDVASFGDAFGRTEGAMELVWADPVAGVYKKLVLSDDARTLLGGVFVGDASPYASLRPMLGTELPGDPGLFLLPEGSGGGAPSLELPRRRHGLLVQQRQRGHHPRRGHRARVHRPRGCQGVHPGGDELRVVPPAGQEDHDDRASPGRASRSRTRCASTSTSRARSSSTPCASRTCTRSARSSGGSGARRIP